MQVNMQAYPKSYGNCLFQPLYFKNANISLHPTTVETKELQAYKSNLSEFIKQHINEIAKEKLGF